MTTTNVYQGLQDKNTSRVLQAPGGSSAGIFDHYVERQENSRVRQQQSDAQRVEQSLAQGGQGEYAPTDNFQMDKNSFVANRNRNHGSGAPFATSDSIIEPAAPAKTAQMQSVVGDDYQTPQQRQAQNPNKGQDTFHNLFGDSGANDDSKNGKAKGKVSTHNPVTWAAYSNYNESQDQPQHRSRYESHAAAKSGSFNPITGRDYDNAADQNTTRVQAPPGGKSSIQF